MLIRLFYIFFFTLYAVVSYAQGVRFADIELRAAKQRATIEDKLIFVDTYASYCKPCKVLAKEFKNPKLAKYLNKHFINVKVDMESDFGGDFKNKYQVVFLPTVMILDKHGNLKFKIDRLASADELLALSKHYQDKLYPGSVPTQAVVQAPVKRNASTAKVKKNNPVVPKPAAPKPAAAPTVVDARIEKVDVAINAAPEEVIVHVFGQGGDEMPPEILKQEAYFRMQLMDGSHRTTAHDYMATQEDWSTLENMRFLFDFLYTVNSEEFNYLINNRIAFDNLIGKDEVDATISIIVNNELERGYPRPDRKKATLLYSYLNVENPSNDAVEYYLNNLHNEDKTEEYRTTAEDYLSSNTSNNPKIYFNLSKIYLEKANSKKKLKKIRPYIERAIELDPSNSSSLLLQSEIEYKLNNVKEAKQIADKALAVAKANSQNVREINKMISRLEAL